jgi:hypothetical protein
LKIAGNLDDQKMRLNETRRMVFSILKKDEHWPSYRKSRKTFFFEIGSSANGWSGIETDGIFELAGIELVENDTLFIEIA